jgi:hypothetical protein
MRCRSIRVMCLMAIALALTTGRVCPDRGRRAAFRHVVDDSGGALPGVEVTVKQTGTG